MKIMVDRSKRITEITKTEEAFNVCWRPGGSIPVSSYLEIKLARTTIS